MILNRDYKITPEERRFLEKLRYSNSKDLGTEAAFILVKHGHNPDRIADIDLETGDIICEMNVSGLPKIADLAKEGRYYWRQMLEASKYQNAEEAEKFNRLWMDVNLKVRDHQYVW